MNRSALELGVGTFLLIGLVCLAYLSFYLGDVKIFDRSSYFVKAGFPNVSGLVEKAPVTIAGVEIGRVEEIKFENGEALVTLRVDRDIHIEEDAIAGIKTMGIIGEKYIAISPGASETYVQPGGRIRDTQPPLDLEEMIGKFVFGGIEKQ